MYAFVIPPTCSSSEKVSFKCALSLYVCVCVCSFTEEEDNLLWGQGETKFDLAKSRLHAWLDRLHYMVLPHPPLDQLVNKLGGPNVRGGTEREYSCFACLRC